jgi:hypothetical protein
VLPLTDSTIYSQRKRRRKVQNVRKLITIIIHKLKMKLTSQSKKKLQIGNFDAFLAVHLSIILVTYQLNAQILVL